MGPHWRATRSECAPEASREERRATADEQHRDWFQHVRSVLNGTSVGMRASLQIHRSASLYRRWRDANSWLVRRVCRRSSPDYREGGMAVHATSQTGAAQHEGYGEDRQSRA